jgi:hypothetical protein
MVSGAVMLWVDLVEDWQGRHQCQSFPATQLVVEKKDRWKGLAVRLRGEEMVACGRRRRRMHLSIGSGVLL